MFTVLINLTTNAIKFTTSESKRTISVTIAASVKKPSEEKNPVVNFFPPRSKRVDLTKGRDWGEGEEVYIQFSVEDTGRGLTEEEMTVLFQRFSQASPRTHVVYGGSGLGLFISRELTELQGGEIGVASQSGKGSTFAFFVKARRTTAPMDTNAQDHIHIDRKPSEHVDVQDRNDSAVRARDFAPIPPEPTKQPFRVLIVEDNLVNQRVLQKQLTSKGCITYVANHGGECLDKLKDSVYWRERGPDAIEIDVVLLGMWTWLNFTTSY